MSGFAPTTRIVEPPALPDPLAEALLLGLGRPLGGRYTPSAVESTAEALLTVGVLPALIWPLAFRKFVTAEQQHLQHLADWLRQNSTHPAAPTLVDAARRIKFRPWLAAVPFVCLAWIVWTAAAHWSGVAASWWDLLLASTYGFTGSRPAGLSLADARAVFAVWSVGLSLAYASHWLHVQLHAASVSRFIERFNDLAAHEGVAPIDIRPAGIGFQPMWLLGAAALLLLAAVWAIPMALAGGLNGSYIGRTSLYNRLELARRLRQMLCRRMPDFVIPDPIYWRLSCPRRGCGVRAPEGAKFCPLCGAKLRQL